MTRHIGPYRLEELIGTGGMGAVYRAVQENLDRPVALKVLKHRAVADPENLLRFQREMRMMAGLTHPNIVTIYDGGDADGVAYIAMELVPGSTLEDLVTAHETLPWNVALAITSNLAGGLAYLHEQEILHRDVKPANVRVSGDGVVKLLDFGLARWSGATLMTAEGTVLGTIQYMAPEVLVGEPVSSRSDVWSLGCVLHFMLTGTLPVSAPSLDEWIDLLINEPIAPPSQVRPGLPAEVDALVLRLLTQDPERRPHRARAVQERADRVLGELTGNAWDHYLRPGILEDVETHRRSALAPRSPGPAPTRRVDVSQTSLPGVLAPESDSGGPVTLQGSRRRLLRAATILPFATGMLVAIGLGSRMLPTGSGSERPPGVTSITSIPSPSGPATPASVPLSARWRPYEKYLPFLRAGRERADETARKLRQEARPLDFGGPGSWAFWIELSRWLESATRSPTPPRSPESTPGPIPYIDRRLALSYLKHIDEEVSPELVASAFRAVHAWPDDGRTWLVMGRLFEMEGRRDEARCTYEIGLSRLEGNDMADSVIFVWKALARALLTVPGRDLEREWWTHAHAHRGHPDPWSGLREAVVPSRPGVYLRMVESRATVDPVRALMELGWYRLHVDHDPRGAQQAWELGFALPDRASAEFADQLASFHLQRGDVGRARAAAVHGRNRRYLETTLAYVTRPRLDPPAHVPPLFEVLLMPGILEMEALRLIEEGALTEAESLVGRTTRKELRELDRSGDVCLELLGRGSRAGWVARTCRDRLLVDPFPRRLWIRAAGALSDPRGHAWMRRLLGEAGTRWPGSPWPAFLEALWLSRSGAHREALEALRRAAPERATGGGRLPAHEWLEILARPFWQSETDPSARTSLDAYLAEAGPGRDPHRRYWESLKQGRVDEARVLAERSFQREPAVPVWGLSLAWAESLTGSGAGTPIWRDRVVATHRFVRGGLWILDAVAGGPEGGPGR